MVTKETYFCMKMYSMETFKEWLLKEMKKRNLSQNELAKKAGIAHGTISNILNENKGVGESSLTAIAKALKLPAENVYRAAGILPPVAETTEQKNELLFLFDQLPDQEKRSLIRFIRATLDAIEKD